MKAEERFLIDLLGDYLAQKKSSLTENIAYARLYSVAREHNLIAIAYCQIKNAENKDLVAQDVFKNFDKGFFETVFRYDFQKKIINDLDELLCKNKIKHVFFKGAELKELYPFPETRAMGDIDVLISQDNRDRVKELLLENGYVLENSNGPVYDYRKDGILIEMHTKIVSGKVGSSNAESSFLDAIDNADFNGFRGTLYPSYHFAYLITHIAHHFWFYGAGIKLIFDLAVYQKSVEIDYDAVLQRLDEMGLKNFAKYILTVCKKWFGIGIEFDVDTRVTEEFIASFGAFGNAKRNKSAVIERKELEEGRKASAFMTRLRLLFPSYQKLKNIPYISFIEGKPWLTPLAWIYRIFYNLKYKKEFLKEANSKIGDEKTNIQARNELEYFKEIGLL